jgi:excisionase family DNA binding protein
MSPHVDPAPGLLRPAEVARRLSVSRSWVYAAAADGRLPALRLGGPHGPLRFIADDVDSWLAEERARWTPGRG